MAEGVHIYKLATLSDINIVEKYRGFVTSAGLEHPNKTDSLVEEVVLELKKKAAKLGANVIVGFELKVLRTEGKVGKNVATSHAINVVACGTAIKL